MEKSSRARHRPALAPYESASIARALFQILTSIVAYLVIVGVMYWSFGVSYFLTLLLAVPAAACLVRVFIVQHDCGHGSFFASSRNNNRLGALCGMLTMAPYGHWRRQHAQHHLNWNNLDRRESGADIYSSCLTVAEYRALTPKQRFVYRLVRHPLLANLVYPPLIFLLLYRFAFDTPKAWLRERRSVWLTNLCVVLGLSAMILIFGFSEVAMVQLPIIFVTTVVGVWLFSVQHRFEDALWQRKAEWNATDASLEGTSYLQLPRVLQWATGNIGFHHIHHLSQRVPNYRLAACHKNNPQLHPAEALTLQRAFRAGNLTLWDESTGKLTCFRDITL